VRKSGQSTTIGVALLVVLTSTGGTLVQGDNLPEIRIALGMESKEVEKRSTVPMEFKKTAIGSNDYRTVHALVPHRFVYEHLERGFVVPEAKGISMSAMLNRIDQIDVNPQLTFLKIDDAIERCGRLVRLLDDKGWKRDTRKLKNLYSGDTRKTYESLEAIRDVFLDQSLDETFENVGIASWKNDNEIIEIRLERKRYHQPAPADRRKEEKYLITLTLGYSVEPPPWAPGPKRELP
jgi:hypothetical protein